MKGDFSRQTFARKNHYSSVRMQQGRVQLDADWNEQSDIDAHRAQTTTRDLVGPCGGPLGGAAFAVRVLPREKAEAPSEIPGRTDIEVTRSPGVAPSAGSERRLLDTYGNAPVRLPRRPNTGDDFALGAGRYYVDGILCENEQEVRYSEQPDFPEASKLGTAPFDADALYLLYLDVWQRHLTALDDPHIRETALGGPDTATRTKTVWQAKLWKVPSKGGVTCPAVYSQFLQAEVLRSRGLLNASTVPEVTGANPCIVPPSAGYRGLENLLYRVEIHTGGGAADVSAAAGSVAVKSLGERARNQLTVEPGLTLGRGDAVELYPSRAGSDPMAGRLYFITNVNDQTLTLSRDVQGLELSQQPRLRPAQATFKWSRQNGSVVTKIEAISTTDGKEITVQSLGPDDDLGFSDGDLVELTDDLTELRGEPGQLTQIITADNATRAVTLRDAPAVLTSRNAKMRRWDGVGPVRTNKFDADTNWITLENGLRIQFPAQGSSAEVEKSPAYAAGDYWLIPTRTATADRESGQIEWPADRQTGLPQPQLPEGVEHHYCPLALLDWSRKEGVTVTADCRRFFPPVTKLTALHYVSGTGQEAMPELPPAAGSLVELLHPLVVGVSNGGMPVKDARVVFEVVEGELNEAVPDTGGGRLSAVPGGNAVNISDTKIEVRTDAGGLAACKWELATTRWNQQVVARLLGQNNLPVHLPVRFNANLSVAREVAYEPGQCERLDGVKTVQEALDKLCELIGLVNEPGIHVTRVTPGVRETRAGDVPVRPDELRPLPLANGGETIGNDFDLACDVLAEGLTVTCDSEVYPGSVKGKPTCFVTLELPFPFGQSEREAWGVSPDVRSFIGYQPIVLDGDADAEGKLITWRPSPLAAGWLRQTLSNLFGRLDPNGAGSRRAGRVLARLTLKGNFIWARKDASLYLDGELFGVVAAEGNVTAARGPSGDGRRGGDLELWFWLVQFELRLDRSNLNVGERTTGRVILSGPAPPQGLTVGLTVTDKTVAAVSTKRILFAEGQTEGAFEVTADKLGQTDIRATYAAGVREVSVNVAVAAPPRVESVSVNRSQLTPGNAVLAEMNPSTGLPPQAILTAPSTQTPNAIQVKFTGDAPVDLAAVTTKNFVVRLRATTGPVVPGSVAPVQGSNAVLWRADQPLLTTDYHVTLVGDGADAITSVKGKRLDGDPKQLPSGEGQEGGNFKFVVRVQPTQTPAPMLKVRRVALIRRSGSDLGTSSPVETVLFQAQEGAFNNSIQLPTGGNLNVIEIEFTGGPVNKESVKQGGTFLVRRTAAGAPAQLQEGQLSWPSASVVRWTSAAPLSRGSYSVALLSGNDPITSQPPVAKITAADGRGLDGEPSRLPSGNNAADGTFFFTVLVT